MSEGATELGASDDAMSNDDGGLGYNMTEEVPRTDPGLSVPAPTLQTAAINAQSPLVLIVLALLTGVGGGSVGFGIGAKDEVLHHSKMEGHPLMVRRVEAIEGSVAEIRANQRRNAARLEEMRFQIALLCNSNPDCRAGARAGHRPAVP